MPWHHDVVRRARRAAGRPAEPAHRGTPLRRRSAPSAATRGVVRVEHAPPPCAQRPRTSSDLAWKVASMPPKPSGVRHADHEDHADIGLRPDRARRARSPPGALLRAQLAHEELRGLGDARAS